MRTMNEDQKPLRTQKLAIAGMSCANCETLIATAFRTVPGVEGVRIEQGYAEVDHRGDIDLAALQRAIEAHGYSFSPFDAKIGRPRRTGARDYAEIAGLLAILVGAAFALQHFGLMPRGYAVSEGMTLGLVFLVGLVASISSCMAVTGGLLVAAAAAYNDNTPGLTGFQRLKPHLYFNAGRILSYTLLGGAIGAVGSALTLSPQTNGLLTIAASAIMIVLGLQMLGLLPRAGRLLPRSFGERVHRWASTKVVGSAFALGALTFFLPCGFTQALQLYVLSMGSVSVGALTMFVFALGTLPALLSLSALSSFARGAFQKHFLRLAGAAVVVLGLLNIQYGAVLSGLGSDATTAAMPTSTAADAPAAATQSSDAPVAATQIDGKQVVIMRVVDFNYMPAVFEVKQGIPVEWRIDASEAVGCGLVLLAPGLGIRRLLSSVSTTSITFTPRQAGEFQFNCGMGMMSPWEARFIVVPAG
jgi:sulfite exporter TauE/SafE/copper chaperone CopZ